MYLDEYKRWLAADLEDADLKPELVKVEGNDDEIKDRFAVALKFGTAGLRGVLGADIFADHRYTRTHEVMFYNTDAAGNPVGEGRSANNDNKSEDWNKRAYLINSQLMLDFDRTFGKTGYLRYRTTVQSFYGWISDIGQKNKISDYSEYRIAYDDWVEKGSDIKTKPRLPIHPIVRWENTIDIKATKYLSTSLSFQLYYNRAQNVDVQTRTLLSVGLTYTFKNKEKPQK